MHTSSISRAWHLLRSNGSIILFNAPNATCNQKHWQQWKGDVWQMNWSERHTATNLPHWILKDSRFAVKVRWVTANFFILQKSTCSKHWICFCFMIFPADVQLESAEYCPIYLGKTSPNNISIWIMINQFNSIQWTWIKPVGETFFL